MADLTYQQHGAQHRIGAHPGNKLAVILNSPAHQMALEALPMLDRQVAEQLAALGSDGDRLELNIVQLRGR